MEFLHLTDKNILVIDYSGTITYEDGISNMDIIEKEFRKSSLKDKSLKLIFDFRNTVWENRETHDALSVIARKIFNSRNFDFMNYTAILNNEIEGPTFKNEYWFIHKEDAIKWLENFE
jgi:hypothetical protein